MRVALDTNILAYAEGVNDPERQAAAIAALRSLSGTEILVPVQALGELFNVLVRKGRRSPEAALIAVRTWSETYPVIATTPQVLTDAMELAATRGLAIWDSVMLAAAAQAGCRVLLSEDMQDGFGWRGVAVRNPFIAR